MQELVMVMLILNAASEVTENPKTNLVSSNISTQNANTCGMSEKANVNDLMCLLQNSSTKNRNIKKRTSTLRNNSLIVHTEQLSNKKFLESIQQHNFPKNQKNNRQLSKIYKQLP